MYDPFKNPGKSNPPRDGELCCSRQVITFREVKKEGESNWSIAYYRHQPPFGKPGWVDIQKGEIEAPDFWYELPGEALAKVLVEAVSSNISIEPDEQPEELQDRSPKTPAEIEKTFQAMTVLKQMDVGESE